MSLYKMPHVTHERLDNLHKTHTHTHTCKEKKTISSMNKMSGSTNNKKKDT
jgi:hypothetical protein